MPQVVAPIHHQLASGFMQLIDQYYNLLQQESQSHTQTLKLLQDLKTGDMTLDRVIISDDGYRILPELQVDIPEVKSKQEAKNSAGPTKVTASS